MLCFKDKFLRYLCFTYASLMFHNKHIIITIWLGKHGTCLGFNYHEQIFIALVGLIFSIFHTLASAQIASDYQQWRLPATAPSPADNQASPVRQELGKMLFFDTHLSGDNKSACISCHIPELGWSDGKPVSIGFARKTHG